MQFGVVASMGFDLCLSFCYLLMVQGQWNERDFKQLEKWMHGVIWPLAVIPAMYLLSQQMYGPSQDVCWIINCAGDPFCRLQNSQSLIFRSGVHVLSIFHFFFSIYVMTRVYNFATHQRESTRRSFARRGLLYASTVAVVQVPLLMLKIASLVSRWQPSRPLTALTASTIPLGGFLLMLVFMINRRNMQTCYGRLVRSTLDAIFCYKEEPGPQPVGPDLFSTSVAITDHEAVGERNGPAETNKKEDATEKV